MWDAPQGVYRSSPARGHAISWLGPRINWRDYTVEVRLRVDAWLISGANSGFIFRAQSVQLPDGGADPPNSAGQMYFVGLSSTEGLLFGFMNDGWTRLAAQARPVVLGTWYRLRVEVTASSIRIYVDDSLIINHTDTRYAFGTIGLRTFETAMSYDSVRVTCQ